jgi:uncharacterized membrane protein
MVDHQILTIHHVREGVDNTWVYEGGLLAFGALLVIGGLLLARSGERISPIPPYADRDT